MEAASADSMAAFLAAAAFAKLNVGLTDGARLILLGFGDAGAALESVVVGLDTLLAGVRSEAVRELVRDIV